MHPRPNPPEDPRQGSASGVFLHNASVDNTDYSVFFAELPPPSTGSNGDIWFSSDNNRSKDAWSALERNKRNAFMDRFPGSLWFYDTNTWVPVSRDISDQTMGVTTHLHPWKPQLSLDCLHFTWRPKASISTTKRRREETESGVSKRKKAENNTQSQVRYLPLVPGGSIYPNFHFVTEDNLIRCLVNPNNGWLINLAMQWQVVSTLNGENREAGLGIFRALLSHQEGLNGLWNSPGRILAEGVHKAEWKKVPRLSDIFDTINHNPDLSSIQVCFCGAGQCHTSLVTPAMAMETWVMGSTEVTGLSSILSTPDPEAEKSYSPILPSHISSSPGKCAHWKNPTTNSIWDFSIVPGAGLTNPHVDSWASEIYISHLRGKKLWLLWPGTPDNYRLLYSSVFLGSDCRLDTEKAIESLHGLEVLFVSEEDGPLAWTLPAGTIHAVLTFSRAAIHGGFHYIPISRWERSQNAIAALRKTPGIGCLRGDESGIHYLVETLRFMGPWTKVALDIHKKQGLHPNVQNWIVKTVQEIENDLTQLKVKFSPISSTSGWVKLSKLCI